jgi:carbon-monoxide dehydrogenase medium subunit
VPSAFAMLAPATVEDALGDLERLGPGAHLYAGGVELAMLLSSGALAADYLIDIKRIPGLAGVRWDGDAVRIGATTTHDAVARDPGVRDRLPLLAEAESRLGNVRVRHSGTVGGNLSLRYSHSDLLPPLLVYEATVAVATSRGAEEVPLASLLDRTDGVVPEGPDLLRGTSERVGAGDRVITSVRVPVLPAGWGQAYVRSERLFRPPDLNAAIAVRVEGGRLGDVRIAMGCRVPHARRLTALESELRGADPGEARERIAASREELARDAGFQADLVGSVEYKAHLAATLLARGLEQALEGGA